MLDNVRYCDVCARRLTPEDFAVGDAIEKQGKAYCADCTEAAPKTTQQRPAAVPKARRPSASSSRLKAAKRSGASSSSKQLKALRRRGRKRRRPPARRGASSRTVPRPRLKKGPVKTVSVNVTCPHCSESFVVEEPDFKRDFICPACGGAMRLKPPRRGLGRSRHG